MATGNPTRRTAREWAIQLLTALDLNPSDDLEATIGEFFVQQAELAAEDDGFVARGKLRAFAEERVRGVMAKRDEIDAMLAPLLENWDLRRLGTVERAVLRLGVWEIRCSDVPKPVAINEAIDLANWFSSPKSRTLINGILDKVVKV